ncbi:putative toxin-antitoxin system toxin component, PIN family [Undibacterium sp. LX40W]|uniref:Toxin-antitoxin system toxin component, PIN family n=1 Tax=Undibacterium nitidum TaxID=2762298 RepID=A0A923HI93_9BURK|nr:MULTISPECIES: putative toxin-antitoxin system toxin component, PIN family [Undibacterium]MBC3879889.1 putative toxin-antitoxin system toxin component, PIN family [Undibacterium nitidum]MBC3891375.1 putative toxin-antitoxin system toxin component, PIN family [Undibacterium sp. LX40W]
MSLKIVLDTNVCLDLFAFHDPRWTPIMNALADKSLHAITRDDCREEWLAVLHYPHLPVDDQNRGAIVASFDEFISVQNFPAKQLRLPICTDKDDQKFLEISRDAEVAVLVSKDKALLKLARKTKALGLFSIETPEQFVTRLVANPQGL